MEKPADDVLKTTSCAKATNELSTWIDDPVSFETLAIHGGTCPDTITGSILTPIYLSTTFVQPSVELYLDKGYSYSRQSNPTVKALELRIASLEKGFDCVCVSSGMAATVTIFSTFLKPGDHCILPDCSYGGTNRCARVHFSKYNIDFSYVDMRNIEYIKKEIKKDKTKLIFTETTSNPTLRLTDIAAVSALVKPYNILHVCDSTFSTPFSMQPLDFGADIVLHSTTKYFDGHNMTVGGALIVKNREHFELLSLHRNILGNNMTPHVAHLVLQTCKTLPIRLERQSKTASYLAKKLKDHPKVDYVFYPGLDDYEQKELARKQYKNGLYGNMISFEVKGGTKSSVKLMNSVKRPWSLCENLGASESIITCAAVFTHANMLREDRLKVGITDGLIRLSVGLEDAEDLLHAMIEALDLI